MSLSLGGNYHRIDLYDDKRGRNPLWLRFLTWLQDDLFLAASQGCLPMRTVIHHLKMCSSGQEGYADIWYWTGFYVYCINENQTILCGSGIKGHFPPECFFFELVT